MLLLAYHDTASEGLKVRGDVVWPCFTGKKIHNASGGAAGMVELAGEKPSQADPEYVAK